MHELAVIVCLYHDSIQWGWFFLFALAQSTFFPFWTPDFLRGYGVGTPNGSLWTIGVIIQFYLVAWLLFRFLAKRKKPVYGVVFIISVAVSLLNPFFEKNLPELLYKLYGQTLIPYFWIFFLGVILAEFSDRLLPVLGKYWWFFGCTSALFLVIRVDLPGSYPFFTHFFQIVAVIGFAFAFPKLEIKTDISYGLYLYHMTVVNVFVTYGLMGKIQFFAAVMLISCVLAWISTKTVGTAMGEKKKLLNHS